MNNILILIVNHIFKIFIIDVGIVHYYNSTLNNYNVLCKKMNIFRITNILKYIIIKLNQIINKYYSIFLGHRIIYFLILIILICDDRSVQTVLGIFICLDYFVSFFNLRKNNPIKQEKYLTPSLNIYYPISFSIFSVTIRITGIFLSLILGFGCIYLFQ